MPFGALSAVAGRLVALLFGGGHTQIDVGGAVLRVPSPRTGPEVAPQVFFFHRSRHMATSAVARICLPSQNSTACRAALARKAVVLHNKLPKEICTRFVLISNKAP